MVGLGAVRAAAGLVFVGGIVGMIVGSIADNNGTAVTFGLATAVAAVALMAVSATSTTARRAAGSGEEIERRIEALVAAGADEREIRALVRLVRRS